MNQNPGILGKKIGMTQIFDEKGEVLRCTVVQGGCVVIGKRTVEKDGYSALIIGLGLYPQPLLDVINPAVETTLDEVGVTDPEPDVPVEAESTQEQETSQ